MTSCLSLKRSVRQGKMGPDGVGLGRKRSQKSFPGGGAGGLFSRERKKKSAQKGKGEGREAEAKPYAGRPGRKITRCTKPALRVERGEK